jgi:Heparinase II/III-like protein/Heparinase II/III N-terminus
MRSISRLSLWEDSSLLRPHDDVLAVNVLGRARSVCAPARWYVRRAMAMSPQELGWRATAPVRRLRPLRNPGRPGWTFPSWLSLLEQLVSEMSQEFAGAAERIAAGELQFWGRGVKIDPHHPDWYTDPIEGRSCPAGSWRTWPIDPKRIWELHRQQHLVPLAAGAFVDDNTGWTSTCIQQLVSWTTLCPPRRGPGWTSGYETAHRLIGWAWAVPLLAVTTPAGELELLADSFAAQEAFVESNPSRFSSANNHRILELVGLLAASLLKDGIGWSDRWRELEDEVTCQTYEDGGSREQAGGYFLYVLEALWVAGLFAHALGEGLGRLDERLRAMLDWLRKTADTVGEPPPFGDDAEDRPLRLDYFDDRRAALIAARVESLLAGEPSLRETPVAVEEGSVVLPESGVAVLRSRVGGTAGRLVYDVGNLGFGRVAAHGHADALSVLLDFDGRALLRDAGTGSYVASDGRVDFRMTHAHNTVVVGDRSQAVPCGPHLWGRQFRTTIEIHRLAPEHDYVRASHDGYRPLARHIRSVSLLRPDNIIVVLDRVVSRRAEDVQLVWNLPLDDTMSDLAGHRASASVAAIPEPTTSITAVPFSPRYGRRELGSRFIATTRGRDVVFATAIQLGADDPPALTLELLGDGTTFLAIGGPRVLEMVETWRQGEVAVAVWVEPGVSRLP